MPITYHQMIRDIITSIQPFDPIEKRHQQTALTWIDSGAPLCRLIPPETPPRHLVAYFLLFDPNQQKLLLVDHKKAELWLPTGGHIEPNEHPRDAADRELKEELGVALPLWRPTPLFITETLTVGHTAGHTDVSLWYIYVSDASTPLSFDNKEFYAIQWFSIDDLPLHRSDPHLARFCSKFRSASAASQTGEHQKTVRY